MTSLEQTGENQQYTSDQHAVDQQAGEPHTGETTGAEGLMGKHTTEAPTTEAPTTEERSDMESSGAEHADPQPAGEPIAANHLTGEHSTDQHSTDQHSAKPFFNGTADSPADLQTHQGSEETSENEDQPGVTTSEHGAVSDSGGAAVETASGTNNPSAEEIQSLMEDGTAEAPDDALGQKAPGASAARPASAELAAADHAITEAGQRADSESSINGSNANGSAGAADLMDGSEQSSAAAEPAPGGPSMQTFFEDLLQALGVQGSIVVREDNQDEVTLDIRNCPDASLIIGRHGQTVDDLQYLGSLVLNNNRRERRRFMLNVENYRERREESLRQSAITLAHQVAELGQEAVLDPLPPHERRIVHMALVDIAAVYTYSEGQEPDRRIVISPRNLGGIPVTEERGDDLIEPTPDDEIVSSDTEESSPEGVNTEDNAGELNEDFGESESLAQQVERDSTEFGLANEEPAAGDGGSSPSKKAYELDGDEPLLPQTTPGGGSHGGHSGED